MNLNWLLGSRSATVQTRFMTALRGDAPPAYDHLSQLQALADRHGDRATGTSGYEAAAQYVERQLVEAGYRSIRQHFTFNEDGRQYRTFNIIAETATGRDDHVVMLGAHLDSVPGTAGINDNGSGVAALLETAKAINQLESVDHKVRFAWWGAEEFDKSHGSRHYVKNLAKNDPEELRKISSYLNFDMIASPNPVVAVYDARDSDPDFRIPEGSTQVMDLFTGYFDSRNQPWTTTEWGYDSDQVAFAKKGVAVGGLYTGDSDKKTKKEALIFGGEARRPCDPHYHKPGDNLGNVDLGVLALMTDAIIHAATRLATAPAILTKP
jgi:Zn-dependent M28 family amino/carboxypeptidase